MTDQNQEPQRNVGTNQDVPEEADLQNENSGEVHQEAQPGDRDYEVEQRQGDPNDAA